MCNKASAFAIVNFIVWAVLAISVIVSRRVRRDAEFRIQCYVWISLDVSLPFFFSFV